MVLVGSVETAAEVDAVLAVEAEDVLAWRSTNSFCRAELKLDPLLPTELTAPVLVLAALLDAVSSGDGGLNEVLLVLLLRSVTLL